MRPPKEEVRNARLAPDPNDVVADLVERPDAAIDRGIEYGRIDVPLLGELSDRLFAIVGQRDVDEAAELELGEARAGCRANDIELSPHAGGRDVLRRGRPHSGARRAHRDAVSLTGLPAP